MSGRSVTAILAGLTLLCLFMALLTGGAFAKFAMCGDRALIIAQLEKKHQEARQGTGVINRDQGIMELFASAKGTWTVLLTLNSTGQTCIIAAGSEWTPEPTIFKSGKTL